MIRLLPPLLARDVRPWPVEVRPKDYIPVCNNHYRVLQYRYTNMYWSISASVAVSITDGRVRKQRSGRSRLHNVGAAASHASRGLNLGQRPLFEWPERGMQICTGAAFLHISSGTRPARVVRDEDHIVAPDQTSISTIENAQSLRAVSDCLIHEME